MSPEGQHPPPSNERHWSLNRGMRQASQITHHTSPQMNQHCIVDNNQFHAMAALTQERILRYTMDEAEQVGEELSSSCTRIATDREGYRTLGYCMQMYVQYVIRLPVYCQHD
jgi:hypothetical protein